MGTDQATEMYEAFQRRTLELRSSPRSDFYYKQSIAPIRGDGQPSLADMFEVDCKDVSAGGMSFYMEVPPRFEEFLVALGPRDDLTYFRAKVMRVSEQPINGCPRYLVGCRFTGRIDL